MGTQFFFVIINYLLYELPCRDELPYFLLYGVNFWFSPNTWTKTMGLKHLTSQGKLGTSLLEASAPQTLEGNSDPGMVWGNRLTPALPAHRPHSSTIGTGTESSVAPSAPGGSLCSATGF